MPPKPPHAAVKDHMYSASGNADTVFRDDACIRFTMDPENPPPFPFILHVSYPVSAGPVRHNDFTITENVNGLFRLPADVAVTLEVHPATRDGRFGHRVGLHSPRQRC